MDQNDPQNPDRKLYSLVPTQIALFFLAQGTADEKAKAICELFTDEVFPRGPFIPKDS